MNLQQKAVLLVDNASSHELQSITLQIFVVFPPPIEVNAWAENILKLTKLCYQNSCIATSNKEAIALKNYVERTVLHMSSAWSKLTPKTIKKNAVIL